jgi:formate hydrogenlyase subunit 6/NADH:ubiquinone oxidoreductase subunit I
MVEHMDEFVQAFGVWEEARPFLHLMADEAEMRLVVAIQGRPVTAGEAAELLGAASGKAADLLQRAYGRHILDRVMESGVTYYRGGSFYERLDHFAKYERWDDIPVEARRRINRRFLDEFIARHRANVERKMQGLEAENALPNDTVLLLDEVEDMLDAARHIVVQPCDCRRLGQNCERPVETCIWLDDGALEALDRGYGRHLTREEAKDLVRRADKAGLMHTADSEWRTRGLHAICNCCACDCYPFLAAQQLGSKGVWPRSRYVAVYDAERCNLCGACVTRCHFGAFYHDGDVVDVGGKHRKQVVYERDRCWGCGLCVNTCPSGAIVMEPVP